MCVGGCVCRKGVGGGVWRGRRRCVCIHTHTYVHSDTSILRYSESESLTTIIYYIQCRHIQMNNRKSLILTSVM